MNYHPKFLPCRTSLGSFGFCLSLLGVLFLLCSCDSSGDESKVLELEEPIPVESIEEIEPDSSLYRMNVREWNEAPEAKRKANCAGIIRTSVDSFEVRDSEKFNELTEELCSCISQVTHGMPTMNDNAVFDEAKRCLASMGYREESDSLSLN
ncbi:MAG TPA: hypothetical protein VJ949_02935 [Cryomorphaceae bacterium]|nr:hypothetical protein [Cryomorphaceae bacterium]